MAQGISRGSREAQQFIKDSFHSKHQGIEGKGYKERAQFGDNVLRSLFREDELFHFKKTMLKDRAAEDRTHTIEAIEHKAESMLNGLKAHAEDRKMTMHAITSIQSVLSSIKPSEVSSIKNPLLRSLTTIKHGLGNKKQAVVYFAHQVLSNPSYFFGDVKQAKSFISLFLRKNGLGSLARRLRGRGRRRFQRVMNRLAKMGDGFDNASAPKTGLNRKPSSMSSKKTPRVDAKEQSVETKAPKGSIPKDKAVNAAPPAPGQPLAGNMPKVTMEEIDSLLAEVNGAPAVNVPAMPVGIRDQSLEGLAKELEALGVNPHDHPDVSGVSVDDLERMLAELEGNNDVPVANIPPPPALPPRNVARANNNAGGPNVEMDDLDRMLAEFEGNNGAPASNPPPAPVPGNANNAAGNIPPPPPPPPPPGSIPQPGNQAANKGSTGRVVVKGEDIQDINELIPSKPATANSKPSLEKCAVSPAAIDKVAPAIFEALSMERILKLTPEHIVRLTAEQQAALSPELVGDLCYKAAKEGRLSFNEQQEAKLCRKLLVGLDPALVRAKLEASTNPAHKLYLQEKSIGGKPSSELDILYKKTRREDFGLPYQENETVSRMSPEQLQESQNKQQAGAGGGVADLLANIRAGATLKPVTGSAQDLGDTGSQNPGPDSTKPAPTIAGGAGFNTSMLNNRDASINIPEDDMSDDDDWEDEDNIASTNNDQAKSHANPPNDSTKEAALGNRDVPNPMGGVDNTDLAPRDEEEDKAPESTEVKIAQTAVKTIDIQFKMSDIQKNVDIKDTIRSSLEEIVQTRRDSNMPELSEQAFQKLERDLEGIALTDFREHKKDWLEAAQTAAHKQTLAAVVQGIASGRTEEEMQAEANTIAQTFAENALIKRFSVLVQDEKNRMIKTLATNNALGNRRRVMEDDEADEVDDWDD
jgi:hypothetical protein